jgi:SRR1
MTDTLKTPKLPKRARGTYDNAPDDHGRLSQMFSVTYTVTNRAMNSALSPSLSHSATTSAAVTATPAFRALYERYTIQRSTYAKSTFAASIDALFTPNPFSSQLPRLKSIVVLGLGTLTRIPNALWDPESSTYQFLLLEHIVGRQSSFSSSSIEDVFIQDPAFMPLDSTLISSRIPTATVLGALSHGAEPAASLITSTTLLFMPFVDVEIVAECLAPHRAPIVICADIEVLYRRVGCEYAKTRRKATLTCLEVFERFLAGYQGEPVPEFTEKDDAFEGLWVYWKVGARRGQRVNERSRRAATARKEEAAPGGACTLM